MASTVTAAMDQCLVLRMTYIYMIMQTQIIAAAIWKTFISAHQDNRARSSQVLVISRLQITRCLDSASENYQAGEMNSYS